MKRCQRLLKKVMAGVLAVSVTMGSLHFADKTSIVSAAAGFDSDSVVMRLGVLSDLHLNYGQGSETGLKGMVEKYAKAVGTLEQMAKKDGSAGLDVLMIAGDYTNKGVYTEAKIFADASAAIMTAINEGKEENEKTQFFMTYGNHDTEQTGNMSIANWENVLKTAGTEENPYNLMEGITFADDSEGVGAESGCYKYVKEVNGKKYYFFSIETETYDAPSNEFRTDVLEWLDAELAATSKDAYVYVISHAPIKESGVYGADPAYDDNAEWASAEGEYQQTRAGRTAWNLTTNESGATISATSATSYGMYKVDGNINGILKKYPQVVYMSGHTHRTNVLESAIMSKDYTAITVSALIQGELAKGEYIDTPQTGKGYGIYIEVDAAGRQRITRVDLSGSDIVDVTVTGTYTADVEVNYGNLDAYVTESVSITPKASNTPVTLTPWEMAAPDAEGTHLQKYSASARNEEAGNPVFTGNVTVTNIDITNGLSFDFSFPAATVNSNHYIMHYEVNVKDAAGKNIGTKRMYGSWNKAVEQSYHISFTQDELGGTTGFSVSVTAYNEFGGSTTIYWDGNGDGTATANDVKTANFMPAVGAYYENLFDGLTTEDVRAYKNTGEDSPTTKPWATANVWSTAVDEKGNVAFRFNPRYSSTERVQHYDLIVYGLNSGLSAYSFNRWDGFAWYASRMRPNELEPNETFVYATDFQLASGSSSVYFVFREPNDYSDKRNATGYGIQFSNDGSVYLKFWGKEIAKYIPATTYMDGKVHTIVILSAPETVSVWIDDVLVFDNVTYSMNTMVTMGYAAKLENGNYTWTSDTNAKEVGSTMYPVFGFYADMVDLTVSNQFLHVYGKDADLSGETAAMEDNDVNSNVIQNATALEKDGSNNLLTGTEGQIVSSFVGNNTWEGKSDSKVNKTTFYTDLTKGNLMNSGATDYTKEEVFWLFGSENENLVIDGKESFVVSALVNVSNTQQEGQNNRVGLNVAAYDDTRVWYFIESTADTEGIVTSQLKVYHDNTECTMIDISNQYTQRSYNRLTTLISPFGYEIYLNGSSVFSEKLGNGSDVDYSDLSFLASGVEAVFADVSVHYNYENEAVYQEQLLEDICRYEATLEGWYYEQKEIYDNEVAEIKEAYETATDNQTLKTYIGAIDAYRNEILTYGRAVNNPVQQGIATEIGTTAVLDATTGNNPGHYNAYLPVFDSAECPFTTEDTWMIEADVAVSDTSVGSYQRFGLRLLSYGNAIVMLNGNELYHWNPAVNGNWQSLGKDTRINIADGNTLHFKFIITKDQSIQTIITSKDRNTTYFDKTVDFANIGCDFIGRDLYPEFFGVNGKYAVTNVRVMNGVNDELMSAKVGTTVVVDALRTGEQTVSKFVPLFDAGAFPYTTEDTWMIEADVTSYTNGYNNYNRFGLQLADHGGNAPTVMLNNSQLYYNSSVAGEGWQDMSNGQNKNINIGDAGTYHFKFIITRNESIRIIVTAEDGTTQYFNHEASFSAMGLDLTGKDIYPELFGLNGTYTVSNLCISREADIITAGDPANNESRIPFSVAGGETLPIGDVVDGDNALYIVAWTDAAGEPAETYTAGAKVTATVVDKKMLDVKVQTKADTANSTQGSEKRIARFIASLNDVNGYAEGGFILSTKSDDDIDTKLNFNNGCKEITGITTAYTGLYAAGVLYETKSVYDNYSKYMFAYDIGSLPKGTTVYARAYVKLSDGTTILGAVRELTID